MQNLNTTEALNQNKGCANSLAVQFVTTVDNESMFPFLRLSDNVTIERCLEFPESLEGIFLLKFLDITTSFFCHLSSSKENSKMISINNEAGSMGFTTAIKKFNTDYHIYKVTSILRKLEI